MLRPSYTDARRALALSIIRVAKFGNRTADRWYAPLSHYLDHKTGMACREAIYEVIIGLYVKLKVHERKYLPYDVYCFRLLVFHIFRPTSRSVTFCACPSETENYRVPLYATC